MKSQEQASLAPRHLCVSWTGRKPEISDSSNLDSVSRAQWAAERRPPFFNLSASGHRVTGAPCGLSVSRSATVEHRATLGTGASWGWK